MLRISAGVSFCILTLEEQHAELYTTLKAERLVSTLKKPSDQPIGVQILPRSVSELGSGIKPRFVALNQTGNSLHSLIADGAFRATNLGHDSWKALIGPDGSLQLNCNREGSNAVCSENVTPSKARIGIVPNKQNFCYSCDSRIGIRMEGYPDDSLTCGNGPRNYADTGDN